MVLRMRLKQSERKRKPFVSFIDLSMELPFLLVSRFLDMTCALCTITRRCRTEKAFVGFIAENKNGMSMVAFKIQRKMSKLECYWCKQHEVENRDGLFVCKFVCLD